LSIASQLQLREGQVSAALALFDDGATVPFVARYRKEATGGLDEVQLAAIQDRQRVAALFDARLATILKTLEESGKLTAALRSAFCGAADLQRLEDLYEPHKVRRRTRAEAAREQGLAPLAEKLLTGRSSPEALAADAPLPVEQALDGARDILAEQVALDPAWREQARELAWRHGTLRVSYRSDATDDKGAYRALDGFDRPVSRMPADRVLAAFRGEREKQLRIRIELDAEPLKQRMARKLGHRAGPACREWLVGVVGEAWSRLLWTKVQLDVRRQLREEAETVSIEIFARNLEALLMAPPLGSVALIAIDPGYRTGCKVAVLDATGQYLETTVIYPTPPRKDGDGARAAVRRLAERHGASAIAVGNGTGGRETVEALRPLELPLHLVNEAGASIYSASEVARREFAELDLTVRGAISIGRRLQDPLAELVKIEPRSIGVGQYQHDVDQKRLAAALERVVERVVHHVGVQLNTASAELLGAVSGLTPALARKIVTHRNAHGAFADRQALLKVSGLGPRAFELAAGFLRIPGGSQPLDATGIHPETYAVAGRIAQAVGRSTEALIGQPEPLAGLSPEQFADAQFGAPTVLDILEELARPGRDPRGEATAFAFDARVKSIDDLEQGMELPGIVTNVAQFGAFIDLGVKKDGLLHVSKISRAIAIGDVVTVEVLGVERERQRISLGLK